MQGRIQVQSRYALISQNLSKIEPKSFQKSSKPLPEPSQNPPRTFENPPKIDPKSLLDPILDPCLKKAQFRTPKKQPKIAQECPKVGPDRPKPLPHEAQDPPKSNFCAVL